jgi:hypothetical protein
MNQKNKTRKRKIYEINSLFLFSNPNCEIFILFSNHDNNTKILIHFRLKGSQVLQSLNQTLFHHTIDRSQSQNPWIIDT